MSRQLLDDLNKREDTVILNRKEWINRFGRDSTPVLRQTTD